MRSTPTCRRSLAPTALPWAVAAALWGLWVACAPGHTVEPPSPAPAAVAAEPAPGTFIVRYLANEGFLVEAAGQRVLIDGLFGPGIAGYPVVPPETRTEIEQGTGDWGGVQVALATHFHGDHFDAEAVRRFLTANPEATFVSTPQALELLADAGFDPERHPGRTRALLPAVGATESLRFGEIEIEVLNLHHGRRQPPVENLGFVVRFGGMSLLHLGDTEAKMEDFEPYLAQLEGVDLAILPFWFLASEWRAEMVREQIKPRWVIAAHTPTTTAGSHFGRWGSYDNLIQVMRDAFPEAKIPRTTGDSYDLTAD